MLKSKLRTAAIIVAAVLAAIVLAWLAGIAAFYFVGFGMLPGTHHNPGIPSRGN